VLLLFGVAAVVVRPLFSNVQDRGKQVSHVKEREKQAKILGKWEHTTEVRKKMLGGSVQIVRTKSILEFMKDGKVKWADSEGTYKWVNGDHIEITLLVNPEAHPLRRSGRTEKCQVVKVDDEELQVEGKWWVETNEITTFTRVK
jgi:hypothetical protein